MANVTFVVAALLCTAGFHLPVRYASSATAALLARDVDGDGAPDILASGNQVDERGAFSLFANRGDGTFASERLIATGFGQRIEDVADFNGDGAPDLLASDYWSNGIAVYLGPQFDSTRAYATATHGGPSFVMDFDGNGTLDVISLSFGSGNPLRTHFFRGNGDGSLDAKTSFETGLANGAAPSIRTIGGALEILVNERSSRLGVLRYANGNVSVSTIAVGPGLNLTSRFADVNGDGIADIIDTTDDTGVNEPLFISLGNPDGTFGQRHQVLHPRTTELATSVRVGDLDGDGRADLVVGDFRQRTLQWFRGDGAGTFGEAVVIDAGGPVNAFELADVNHDGRVDIVTANADDTISVLINNSCVPRRRAVRH